MTSSSKLITDNSEWSFDLLERFQTEIARIAEKFKLDTYPNQIEVISSEQMMDAYSSVGMPVGYNHWSFGKQFLSVEKNYKRGAMGLAYELVINSNPCISYLMEENTLPMQVLVIAHACYGHNSFFKSNYLFKTWTNADSIIDYLVFAKKYVSDCEEAHGIEAVEAVIDACHSIMNHGVDRYRRPKNLSLSSEEASQTERAEYIQHMVQDLWRTLPRKDSHEKGDHTERFPKDPQENILYFIEKNAPLLETWQRELVRIVRKMAQYFYPQRQTKVMNEGWATFWHYTIMHELYDEGLISEKFMMEFLHNHTNVVFQPGYDSQYYSGINPYTLGFAIFSDLRRICENPTDEDKQWFPDIAGTDWLTTLHFAMENFKDESFVAQFLSPKVIRDLKLFCIMDEEERDTLMVDAIHNEDGYRAVRQALSEQYNIGNIDPDIQVYNVDLRGDRSLTLRYQQNAKRPLSDDAEEVIKHIYSLWGFPVKLEIKKADGSVEAGPCCPPKPKPDPSESRSVPSVITGPSQIDTSTKP
ncbi:MAG: SpoVR family protein [Legionellales bacterium]|nr:SpoVR family protein [Legionellales bacterium]